MRLSYCLTWTVCLSYADRLLSSADAMVCWFAIPDWVSLLSCF